MSPDNGNPEFQHIRDVRDSNAKNFKDAKDAKDTREAPLSETGLSFCQIKELMTHMKKEGVTSFCFGEGKTHLAIARDKEVVYIHGSADSQIPYKGKEGTDMSSFDSKTPEEEPAASGFLVTSPVVGVFYDSPAPDQEPYVSIGSFVKKGDVLCIIEAMKLMNEVNSPVSGRITEILVKKASRVEFGHKLFVIDPGQTGEADHE